MRFRITFFSKFIYIWTSEDAWCKLNVNISSSSDTRYMNFEFPIIFLQQKCEIPCEFLVCDKWLPWKNPLITIKCERTDIVHFVLRLICIRYTVGYQNANAKTLLLVRLKWQSDPFYFDGSTISLRTVIFFYVVGFIKLAFHRPDKYHVAVRRRRQVINWNNKLCLQHYTFRWRFKCIDYDKFTQFPHFYSRHCASVC